MKKNIIIFVVIFLLACATVFCYQKIPGVREKIATLTEKDFSEENIYSDLDKLSERLSLEILNGTESFTIYLKDIDIAELNQINTKLDGVFGSGATYQQEKAVGESCKRVMITIKRTSNYYAMQAYLKNEPIPDDDIKAKELYEVIKEVFATQITADMTDYEKELALHDYVVTHCKYTEETGDSGDDIYRAYGALVNHDAVCNGYAEAMQLLLQCAGIRSKFVVGTADEMEHAWNLVELGGKWYHLDATWNDPLPDQGENAIHSYFNVTDEIMEVSHTWEKSKYPAATDMTYNYYKKNQAYFSNFEEYKIKAYDTMIYRGYKRYEAVIEHYVENDKDMQFIFKNNENYNSVVWQTFKEGKYTVLVLKAE